MLPYKAGEIRGSEYWANIKYWANIPNIGHARIIGPTITVGRGGGGRGGGGLCRRARAAGARRCGGATDEGDVVRHVAATAGGARRSR